jgi:hypothetical protein
VFYERYVQGECEAVWNDLRALGPKVRDSQYFSDAQQVARESMRRVRVNLELLADRLRGLDYQFDARHVESSARLVPGVVPAPADTARLLSELERAVGPLPLSLVAFWEEMEEVSFRGRFTRLSRFERALRWLRGQRTDLFDPPMPHYPDELQIDSIQDQLGDYEEWRERVREDGLDQVGPFAVTIAPDHWHKRGSSGCGSYEIAVPDPGADARLSARHETTLVNYLRDCCRWAGFPGFGEGPVPFPPELQAITQDLLPF